MCYFPVFLCFVSFLELHGFHKETDLMTMTITGMCTGEVIKSEYDSMRKCQLAK